MALAAGIRFFDTARAYGTAENLLGDLHGEIALHGAHVITKLDPLATLTGEADAANVELAVDTSIAKSLHALQTTTLDTLLLHRWSHYRAHQGKIWNRLLLHKRRGTVLELGASIYTPVEALEALADPDIRHLQIPFNVLDWRWKDPEMEAAFLRRPDVTIHARSAFLQGVIPADAKLWPQVTNNHAQQTVDALESLVRELRLNSRAELCIAYALSQPWIKRIVVGVELRQQLAQNLRLLETRTLDLEEQSLIAMRLPRASPSLLDPASWPSRGL